MRAAAAGGRDGWVGWWVDRWIGGSVDRWAGGWCCCAGRRRTRCSMRLRGSTARPPATTGLRPRTSGPSCARKTRQACSAQHVQRATCNVHRATCNTHVQRAPRNMQHTCATCTAQHATAGAALCRGLRNFSGTDRMTSGDICGAGVYLSTDLRVSSNFSREGSGWAHSRFGPNVMCSPLPRTRTRTHIHTHTRPCMHALTQSDSVSLHGARCA